MLGFISNRKKPSVFNLNIQKVESVLDTTLVDQTDLTPENLRSFIKTLNLAHPDIVYAQAMLESGNLTSSLVKTNSNLFGMKVPSSRAKVSVKNKSNYSYFERTTLEGWQMSVIDYALWQSRYANYKSKKDYFDHLSRHYAEDPNYVGKLKNIISKL
jgi:flagellum-specific peptidoglycan hydrolase FlgJ